MFISTSHQSYSDAILRPDNPETAVLFPTQQIESERFLFQSPSEKVDLKSPTLQGQPDPRQDALMRRPDPAVLPPLKVKVLQRWIGRVESVRSDRFVAITNDATNPRNPAEEVEFDLAEVSEGDRSLVAEGAVFYWAIYYHDSPGGQRGRTSSLRFVRSPRLSEAATNRIFEQAGRMAAFLQEK